MDERTKGRARVVALREFFEQPVPRSVKAARPEVIGFWHEYLRSAIVGRRIVEGIVVIPALVFFVVQLVQLVQGKAWLSDVIGTTLGIALGVGLFVILPSRLYFRSIQKRNRRRMDGIAAGQFFVARPSAMTAIMHGSGDGPRRPAWDTWVALPDSGDHPYARVVLPRADDLPEPTQLEVVLGSTGDVLVLWEPGGIYALIPAEERKRSLPSAAAR